MCISGSVGQGGHNARGDVRTIQILLNLSANALGLPTPLVEDGAIGPATLGAIEKFQRQIVGTANPSISVEPGSATLLRLQTSLGQGFNSTKVKGIMINAAQTGVNMYSPALAKSMQDRQINTPLRQAHFLAQIGHESAQLRYAEEIASGAAYEGRQDLGNTQPGDGVRFKGRGLIQLTGRANYAKYGQSIGRDLVTDGHWTQVAEDPALAVDVASWFWASRQLNQYADLDDIITVTKRINGGVNGLDDRKALLNRGKFFLLVDSGTAGH
jgi:putative chitinase